MKITSFVALSVLWFWILWTEYRIHGLETRMNLVEASQHWTEEPQR